MEEIDNAAGEWAEASRIALGASSDVSINGEVVEFDLAAAISPAVYATLNAVAPNWDVSESECDAVVQAWSNVAQIWWPDARLDPKWAALGTAVVTTGMVALPRIGTPPRKPKPTEKEIEKHE